MLLDPKRWATNKPRRHCLECDAFGEVDEQECVVCGGDGYLWRDEDGREFDHGVECACNDCSTGYWVIEHQDVARLSLAKNEHFDDLRDAVVRCVELAQLTGESHQVRTAPALSAPEWHESKYEWDSEVTLEFEHDGNGTCTARGTHRAGS